ncbi:hypothetical protein LCGC14_1438160 [marine sediment metagenome]|uniref:Uncharacterized protein n=1 Tax=marine sediment metagenome TaxID=412755 RepID=A0A0F9JM13_9ZZZZ
MNIFVTEIKGDAISDNEATRRFVTTAQVLGHSVITFNGWTDADLRPAPRFVRNPAIEAQKLAIRDVLAVLASRPNADHCLSVFQVQREATDAKGEKP